MAISPVGPADETNAPRRIEGHFVGDDAAAAHGDHRNSIRVEAAVQCTVGVEANHAEIHTHSTFMSHAEIARAAEDPGAGAAC
jgi:hypothetical protein